MPRPATAWGSSVVLCSPSGSTSLSESPTPLCTTTGYLGRSTGQLPPTTSFLTYVASSSLMSCSRLMLGNFSCKSFFMLRLAPTGTTLTLLQGRDWGRGDGSRSPRSALCPLLSMHQGIYFESEQSHNLSSRTLIRCMGVLHGFPPSLPPSHQHSLVSEVQLLGDWVVVNEQAALNGVQVHLGAEAKGP